MIVRINQLDPTRAEQEAGWAAQGVLGPVRYRWPDEARVYEVLVLDRDEAKRPVAVEFRRQQTRQLIVETIAAVREPGDALVVRLDGPMSEGELLAAMHHLSDAGGRGRFAVSDIRKLDPEPIELLASVRVQPSAQVLAELCADPAVGLDKSVRLRAFGLPDRLVNPLLDVGTTDDERWGEILPQCGFALSTTRGLRSLQVRSRRVEPAEMKSKLVQRLSTWSG